MIIVGIDPGVSGAIAVMAGTSTPEVADMPTVKIKRSEVDIASVAQMIRDLTLEDQVHVFMERATPMPGQGIASTGSYMRGFGQIEGILAATGVPYDLVTPQRWKKAMLDGQGRDKDASRQRAMQLFPTLASQLSRKKDDGRAEALLLAEYGRRNLRGE